MPEFSHHEPLRRQKKNRLPPQDVPPRLVSLMKRLISGRAVSKELFHA